MTGDTLHGDDVKVLFGADSDFQIYHRASNGNSYVHETGGGDLLLQGVDVKIRTSSDGENMVHCVENGAVNLYHNGSQKLATTSTGIDVTGTVTADGLVTQGDLTFTNGNPLIVGGDTDGSLAIGGYLTNSGANVTMYGPTATNANDMTFRANTTKWMEYDHSLGAISLTGNVGIGTSSPTSGYKLDVSGNLIFSSANPEIRLNAGGAWIGNANTANTLTLNTSALERMRIDSSGNVLVGGTSYEGSSSSNASSAYISSGGFIAASVTNDFGMLVNRTGSDGDLMAFRKDGSTVGSIGVAGGAAYISGPSNGVRFTGTTIAPSNNTGGIADGAIQLGYSTDRFKDLYLSGGVYLGGTGAANKLDDYEEGTWTPTMHSGGSLINNKAIYTKIGNVVSLYLYVQTSSAQNGTQFRIGGLPFTATSTNYYAGGSLGYCGNLNTSTWCQPLVINNGTYIYFHRNNGGAHVYNNDVPTSTPLIIQMTYTTNS